MYPFLNQECVTGPHVTNYLSVFLFAELCVF